MENGNRSVFLTLSWLVTFFAFISVFIISGASEMKWLSDPKNAEALAILLGIVGIVSGIANYFIGNRASPRDWYSIFLAELGLTMFVSGVYALAFGSTVATKLAGFVIFFVGMVLAVIHGLAALKHDERTSGKAINTNGL